MTESKGCPIVKATCYIRDVYDEVVALSRCLQERLTNGQVVPQQQYVVEEAETWTTRSKFFEAYVCQFMVKRRAARGRPSYLGCATYLFDLGGSMTFASKVNRAVAVVTWSGKGTKTDNIYSHENLVGLDERHRVYENRLLCWIEKDGMIREEADDQSWCYVVPLTSISTEDRVDDLLIKPLIALATAPQLTPKLVRQAFERADEVMTHQGTGQ